MCWWWGCACHRGSSFFLLGKCCGQTVPLLVGKFGYLGDTLGKGCGAKESTGTRDRCAWGRLSELTQIYQTCIQRVLLNSTETRAMKGNDMRSWKGLKMQYWDGCVGWHWGIENGLQSWWTVWELCEKRWGATDEAPCCAELYCRPQHLDPSPKSLLAGAETKLSLHTELTSVCQSDLVTSTLSFTRAGDWTSVLERSKRTSCHTTRHRQRQIISSDWILSSHSFLYICPYTILVVHKTQQADIHWISACWVLDAQGTALG